VTPSENEVNLPRARRSALEEMKKVVMELERTKFLIAQAEFGVLESSLEEKFASKEWKAREEQMMLKVKRLEQKIYEKDISAQLQKPYRAEVQSRIHAFHQRLGKELTKLHNVEKARITDKERQDLVAKLCNRTQKIVVTRRTISCLENGDLPDDEKVFAESHQMIVREETELRDFERSLFEESVRKGEEYRNRMKTKLLELDETMALLRKQEVELRKEFQASLDRKHFWKLHGGQATSKNILLLHSVLKIQALVRGMHEKQRFWKKKGAATTIQTAWKTQVQVRAAIRIQKLRRQNSGLTNALKRKNAIGVLQRFLSEKNFELKQEHEMEKLLLSNALADRAAKRFERHQQTKRHFVKWKRNVHESIRSRRIITAVLDKWMLGKMSFAFKTWFVRTRLNFQVKNVRGIRILQRNHGANMELIRLFRDSFIPTGSSPGDQNFVRGAWKTGYAQIHPERNDLVRPAPKLNEAGFRRKKTVFIKSPVPHEAEVVLEEKVLDRDWYLPPNIANGKKRWVEHHSKPEVDAAVFQLLGEPGAVAAAFEERYRVASGATSMITELQTRHARPRSVLLQNKSFNEIIRENSFRVQFSS